MRDDEMKAIVDAVVKALEAKGISTGRSGGSGTVPAFKMPGDSVPCGNSGKVFANPLVSWRRQEAGKQCSEGSQCRPGCQNCNPLNTMTPQELRQSGADRVSICHPTEKCSTVAGMIDHTLLKAAATQEEIGKLCSEASKYCFASVCVNPSYVALCAKLLKGSGVKVCTVIGFPLGSTTPTVKAIEARDAIANGADEIDMVINVGALKSGNDTLALDDICAVRDATRGKILKVILETSYLTKEEKVRACLLSKRAGADFVKTSTGFGPGGATVEDVALMRATVGAEMGVKASGGIKDTATAQAMLQAGATRLGTSASISIVTGKTEAGGGKY